MSFEIKWILTDHTPAGPSKWILVVQLPNTIFPFLICSERATWPTR